MIEVVDSPKGSSNNGAGGDARCNGYVSRPIKTCYGNFCGAHEPKECGNQGKPVEYKKLVRYNGVVMFTLYPCNAPQAGCQQLLQAAQPTIEGGGLELKLVPGKA